MKRTMQTHPVALVAAGPRPCASAYGQRWSVGTLSLMENKRTAFGITNETALGWSPT